MKKLVALILLISYSAFGQQQSHIKAALHPDTKTLVVQQDITYTNTSKDTLTRLAFNDWMHGYSSRATAMGARFSDEFDREFLVASEDQRGNTNSLEIANPTTATSLVWERNAQHQDVIEVTLEQPLVPQQQVILHFSYSVKIPFDAFTHYGYNNQGGYILKDCFLVPARYGDKGFLYYDNLNLDDAASALTDYDVELTVPQNYTLSTDLEESSKTTTVPLDTYHLQGKNRLNFSCYLELTSGFASYRNGGLEVLSNMRNERLNEIQQALVINKVVSYVQEQLGDFPNSKLIVSQADYDRNPFYGLNQLPSFISPFPDEFLFEVQFLKTYLNNYLHQSLRLDPRKDNWIYDGIQVYLMMHYIDDYYPKAKMMGNVYRFRLVRGYHLVDMDFNGQYSYFYMLMARKNLDQPLTNSKDTLIRFNEKIASKYRAGLSLEYLNTYLEHDVVSTSIRQFMTLNRNQGQTEAIDFKNLLVKQSPKKIDWFFDTVIGTRDLIDYKFNEVHKTKDEIQFSLTNKTGVAVPIPVYGLKDKQVVFKKWLDVIPKDSIFTVPRMGADQLVLNYRNEVPEFNLRNNWQSLNRFHLNNRPIKFNFMKDLEDPKYNQLLYVPTLEYNLYDGFLPGFQIHNKTIMDKPFIFDITPMVSTKTRNLSGKAITYVSQYYRGHSLYNIKYMLSGNYLHYAPDAYYTKLAPTVFFNFRPLDLRDNRKSAIVVKEIIVDKQKSVYAVSEDTQNYAVFNAKYINTKTEVTHHYHFLADFQYEQHFSKLAAETQYRTLFDNNRQLNLRLFTGVFLSNTTDTDYFDFGLDRPTDYLFESEYIGRSEKKGIFSQQSIVSDGFFKSKLATRSANQWMATGNISYTLWNWIDAYGDVGMLKNKNQSAQFVYDNGIRLNLVTDYFEVFLPVYSNNGWEVGDQKYGEKIRFIITFHTETLINLFTRKWF